MKRLVLIMSLLMIAASCAHYSTTERPESENIINAPVDVVWERTLAILPTERMTIKNTNKETYSIEAKKSITLWNWGDEVKIRLVPKGEKKTLMEFSAKTVQGFGDFGHSGRMVRSIFKKIKATFEASAP